jgi:ATP-dependent Clp protease protease subunit
MPTRKPAPTATRLREAEIEKIEAERDFHRANAEVAHVLAAQEGIALRVRERAEAKVLSQDEFHKVYVFDDDVDDDSVKQCVETLTGWSRSDGQCDIEIQLNTGGGSIFAGFALIDFIRDLRRRGHKVTTVVYGHAASMGAVILQAADKRIIGQNAFLLIHEGSMFSGGDFAQLEDDMKLYSKLHGRILELLAERSTIDKKAIQRGWKRRDWWMDAAEALEHGFVDQVR